jgi:hypothetical protein
MDMDVRLLLDGDRVDLGTYYDVIYGNDLSLPMTLGYEFLFSREKKKSQKLSIEFEYCHNKGRREVILKNATFITTNDKNNSIKWRYEHKMGRKKAVGIFTTKKGNITKTSRIPLKLFTCLPVPDPVPDDIKKIPKDLILVMKLMSDFLSEFENSQYIGPFRVGPKRTYPFSGESPKATGKEGENAIKILVRNYFSSESEKRKMILKVRKWFKAAGISNSIVIKPIGDRYFEVKFTNMRSKETENIADVGYGCSQILPILVGGYNLGSDHIFMIEQPEIHLHPRAQSELGNFIFDLYEGGVQTFVETHSEHLILRLQYLVAMKKIKHTDIKIFYVHTDEHQRKRIKELVLDDRGIFSTEWPGGFFPERYEASKRIAELQI